MSVPTAGLPILAAFQRGAQARAASTPLNIVLDQANTGVEPTNCLNITTAEPPKAKRAVHNVLTINDRTKIASWMTTYALANGPNHVKSKAVAYFPTLFRSSGKANLMKASRLWKTRYEYVDEQGLSLNRGSGSTITRNTYKGTKRVNLKVRVGRGRKMREWVRDLQLDMVSEFDRLRKLGVKFNWKTLQTLAFDLVNNSSKVTYNKYTNDGITGKSIIALITRRWIQNFTDRHRIVSRAHTGKYLISPEKQDYINKTVAYHLGQLASEFRAGQLREENVENADETHFQINLDNGRTLGFCGEREVKYSDVVSGGEGMTMVVRISGGVHAKIEPVFMVFQNQNRSYPIRGVPDDIPNVSYRSGPKGWMDTKVMPQWLRESKVIKKLPNGRKRIMYVDNCSGHNLTPNLLEAAGEINTEVRFFPPNATDMVQPADSFIIQKIKSAWNARWERYKMEKIKVGAWSTSGKVMNPGKSFFLRLAALVVQDVNRQRDVDGLTYARKAMIRTGMALNVNGLWEERQLFPKLQQAIVKHRNHFNGEIVEG